MKIKYLGHASFLIASQQNTRIITDPYNVSGGIKFNPINEAADIVTVSHGHGDHNNAKAVKGNPVTLNEAGSKSIKGIEIKAIPAFHDGSQGRERGKNLIFCFRIDDINVCHLGDLGHQLTPQQLSDIGPVDILLIPVGGLFTINPAEAAAVIKSVNPKVAIPMHFKGPKVDFPIAPVADLTRGQKNVRELKSSEAEFTKTTLPSATEILVLQPSQ